MTTASDVASGKTHTDENFPVASHLIAARHRPAVMAFYHFVRAADDVADHATLTPGQKLDHLDRLEQALLGRRDERRPVAKRYRHRWRRCLRRSRRAIFIGWRVVRRRRR